MVNYNVPAMQTGAVYKASANSVHSLDLDQAYTSISILIKYTS